VNKNDQFYNHCTLHAKKFSTIQILGLDVVFFFSVCVTNTSTTHLFWLLLLSSSGNGGGGALVGWRCCKDGRFLIIRMTKAFPNGRKDFFGPFVGSKQGHRSVLVGLSTACQFSFFVVQVLQFHAQVFGTQQTSHHVVAEVMQFGLEKSFLGDKDAGQSGATYLGAVLAGQTRKSHTKTTPLANLFRGGQMHH